MQASEKVYQSFELEVKNKGGHSSRPVKENAIYHLAAGLMRLAQFDFPVTLKTRAYFERVSKLESVRPALPCEQYAHSAVLKPSNSRHQYNATMRTRAWRPCSQPAIKNALPQNSDGQLPHPADRDG